MRRFYILLVIPVLLLACQETDQLTELAKELRIENPQHGFISTAPASRWEESLISGNGTIGLTMPGDALKDRIIFGHENLFMPEYQPYDAPDLGSRLPDIREAIFGGRNDEAASIMDEEARKVGIEGMIWTNPPVPACQLEFESLEVDTVDAYARSTNFESGEISVAYKAGNSIVHRSAFVSRADGLAVIKFSGLKGSKLNYKFALNQLPVREGSRFNPADYVDVAISTSESYLHYHSEFRNKWEGSVKGHDMLAKVVAKGGEIAVKDNYLLVTNADEILIYADILVADTEPVDGYQNLKTKLDGLTEDYYSLLERHVKVHSEIFNRFSLSLGADKKSQLSSEELLESSSFENTNPDLVEQLLEAARYNAMSSAGELPPTLQGIWGGTWRPMWSGDYTLNGNVPSAIASGLNTNMLELTDSYLNMMNQMKPDFEKNASGLYGLEGIYVPSRVSDNGCMYHYGIDYPHLYWNAGTAWAASFYYDKWLYTCDTAFLKAEAIPFMVDAYKFLSQILYKTDDGSYMFIPSYSPEISPIGVSESTINATMDVASMKQLLRNLIALVQDGFIDDSELHNYKDILDKLPEYAIDKTGELKEWIWDSYENNTEHRHASHLYPLYDGIDDDFIDNTELQNAAKKAIESRLEFRRTQNNGMAFGLVQLGMAAAHLGDTAHAYECVRWLSNLYWTTGQVSYHDPGAIFNLDISGGLPAVVSYMLLQSTPDHIQLLPCLPKAWPNGKVKGLPARGGFVVDIEWEEYIPVKVVVRSIAGKESELVFGDLKQILQLPAGEQKEFEF